MPFGKDYSLIKDASPPTRGTISTAKRSKAYTECVATEEISVIGEFIDDRRSLLHGEVSSLC